ncbi:hypothetical protein C2E23DRAFT_842625 [Lenzites betulinus]|nr:hypothetical protein C2E23DRAFT_842625 [Lenzites betulinus]
MESSLHAYGKRLRSFDALSSGSEVSRRRGRGGVKPEWERRVDIPGGPRTYQRYVAWSPSLSLRCRTVATCKPQERCAGGSGGGRGGGVLQLDVLRGSTSVPHSAILISSTPRRVSRLAPDEQHVRTQHVHVRGPRAHASSERVPVDQQSVDPAHRIIKDSTAPAVERSATGVPRCVVFPTLGKALILCCSAGGTGSKRM